MQEADAHMDWTDVHDDGVRTLIRGEEASLSFGTTYEGSWWTLKSGVFASIRPFP